MTTPRSHSPLDCAPARLWLAEGAPWVRGYHKELPQRLDTDLLIRELLEAAKA